MIPRLKILYAESITKNLMAKLQYKNKHEVPKILKVVINMGLGEDAADSKKIKKLSGRSNINSWPKGVITKFKKSISNFKTRKGANAGIKVTLRSDKMYEFIDRLSKYCFTRIKDFRGLSSKGIDNSGNYSFGIKEHIIFSRSKF